MKITPEIVYKVMLEVRLRLMGIWDSNEIDQMIEQMENFCLQDIAHFLEDKS